MKRFLILFALLFIPTFAGAKVRVTLNVTANPSPYLSDWTTRKETVILTITSDESETRQVKLDARVLLGGALQARTMRDKVPTFTVRPGINTFHGEDLVPARAVKFIGNVDRKVIRSGRLPSGSYQICVTVFDARSGADLSPDQCSPFRIQSYRAPTPIAPRNGAKVPPPYIRMAFEWTAVSPQYSPRQRYQIEVRELREGQTPEAAFRANRPILDRTVVGVTRLVWPSGVAIDTPMTYVWSVRALDDAGNPLGETEGGWSQPQTFTVGGHDTRVLPRPNGQGAPPIGIHPQMNPGEPTARFLTPLACPGNQSDGLRCGGSNLKVTWADAGTGAPFNQPHPDAGAIAKYLLLTIELLDPSVTFAAGRVRLRGVGAELSVDQGSVAPSTVVFGAWEGGLCVSGTSYPLTILVGFYDPTNDPAAHIDVAFTGSGECHTKFMEGGLDDNGNWTQTTPPNYPGPYCAGCIAP
jgi:hypothetical protein